MVTTSRAQAPGCYVQSLACVMCSHEFVLCVAFSVPGSLLKRLIAAVLILPGICVYICI